MLAMPKMYRAFWETKGSGQGKERRYADRKRTSLMLANMTGTSRVHQPLPMDQPTTPIALPLPRALTGQISACMKGKVSKAWKREGSEVAGSRGTPKGP